MASILAANALTTVAAVLDELALDPDSAAQDGRIERYINAASDWIERHCGRTFRREDDLVEKVKGHGRPTIRVSRPIVAITSIVVDGVTIDAADYTVEDADRGKIWRSAGWPWTALERTGITQPQVPGWEDPTRIVVTYDGGYVTPAQVAAGTFTPRTLPYQIEDAAIRLVVSRWRGRGTDGRIASEAGQNSSITYDDGPIPRAVLTALAPFARYPNA